MINWLFRILGFTDVDPETRKQILKAIRRQDRIDKEKKGES